MASSRSRSRSRRRSLLREFVGVFVAMAVVLVARQSFADHYVVPTGSMEPTVQVSDHVLVEKAAYGLQFPLVGGYVATFDGPARGDVVVLTSPVDGTTLLKRVVALPGDSVAVRGGELALGGRPVPVHTDGEATYEDLGAAPHRVILDGGGGPDFGPVTVPAGEYLVMGDHRGDSFDGRMFGFVPRSAIFGRAVGVFLRGGALTWAPL
jgi:signal peptidase I